MTEDKKGPQSPKEWQQKITKDRASAIVVFHKDFKEKHVGPEPSQSHEDLIQKAQDWYEGYRDKKHKDFGQPTNQENDEIRVKRKGELLIIEEPANYAPYDERIFDQRWIYDKNGRLVQRLIGQSDELTYEYSSDGHIINSTDIHNGGYGSETKIDWSGDSVSRMVTQFFVGKMDGMRTRGENDGEPITTNF